MGGIRLTGKLLWQGKGKSSGIPLISVDTSEIDQTGIIELEPLTGEEKKNIKIGDCILVKHKVVSFEQGEPYCTRWVEPRQDIVAILPTKYCRLTSNDICTFCGLPKQPRKEEQPKYAYCESCIGGDCDNCFMPLLKENQGGIPGYYHRREEQPKEMPEVPVLGACAGLRGLSLVVKDLQDHIRKLEAGE